MYNLPQQHSTAVFSRFQVDKNNNGAGYSELFSIGEVGGSSAKTLSINGVTVFGTGGGVTQFYGATSGYAFYNSVGSIQYAGLGASGRWSLTPTALTTAATINTWSLAQTWNNASGVYSGINMNITNTSSNNNSTFATFQESGANRFRFVVNSATLILGSGGNATGIGAAAVGSGLGSGTGTAIRYLGTSSSTAGFEHWFQQGAARTATAGESGNMTLTGSFAPTSGTGTYNHLSLTPTINQTGGANGISRGIYINPTLTAAADWRAIEIASTSMGSGAAGPVVMIGRNSHATPGAGSINLLSNAGTNGYVWQDTAGNLRIHTAAPTNANDTAGTVVGAQSSTRETKQDIEDYTEYRDALALIVDAPLHTFRYIKEVEGYGSDSPLAKTRIGFIADEVDQAFMVGNVIDQVSVNGLLMAAIKEIDLNMQVLPVLEDRTLATKIADFLRGIAENGIAIVDNLKTKKVQTQELCVGDEDDEVCITKDQLRAIIEQNGFTPNPSTGGESVEQDPEQAVEDPIDTGSISETPTEEQPTETPIEEDPESPEEIVEEAPAEEEPSEPTEEESAPETSPEPAPSE